MRLDSGFNDRSIHGCLLRAPHMLAVQGKSSGM
jgi:hypothetical protein